MPKKKKNEHREQEFRKINIWAMVRDLGLASINKGQLPVFGVIVIIAILMWKLEPKDCYTVTVGFLAPLSKNSVLGYVLFLVTLMCWFLHTKSQRRNYEREFRRITEERNRLQEKLIGGKLESSQEYLK